MPTPSEPSYRLITLTKEQFAIVDVADYDWLSQWKWRALEKTKTGIFYAVRNGMTDGKRYPILMHRFILHLESGNKLQGDHINGNTLDNRRSNLRISTHIQNNYNRGRQINNTTGYKGVWLDKTSGLYAAEICAQGKKRFLGRRKTALEAHELYCAAATELHGRFAKVI